jgi:hypothetical protein
MRCDRTEKEVEWRQCGCMAYVREAASGRKGLSSFWHCSCDDGRILWRKVV